tara:strand:+ start:205 stop:855 length:651 start_codon:yes stop_codon:yes gene_type:complete
MNEYRDTSKHQGQRKQLVDFLKKKGITSQEVIKSLIDVPRHYFMDRALEDHAYTDKAYPIQADQTISQPYTVAFQTQLLQLKKKDKTLEIGTGSGYQTAILSLISSEIYTIERQHELFKKSKKTLNVLGYRIKKNIFGDGYFGFEQEAPYDVILVTAGAPVVPKALMKQLKIGGRLVIPVGENSQIMTRLTRISDKEFNKETFGEFKFVPLLKNKN